MGCNSSLHCPHTACIGAGCPWYVYDIVGGITYTYAVPRFITEFTDEELITELQRRLKK